jgi:hypothetical protein
MTQLLSGLLIRAVAIVIAVGAVMLAAVCAFDYLG